MDDLYGRTGLSGRAGLSRLEELLHSGRVPAAEIGSMLDTMHGQSNLSTFLPSTHSPAPQGPLPLRDQGTPPRAGDSGGQPGHGTILVNLLSSLLGSTPDVSTGQYQTGRALGELMRARRGR